LFCQGNYERIYRVNRRGTRGKLKGAVKHWLDGGKKVEDRTGDDAAAFGIKVTKEKKLKKDEFEVWDENWDTVMMFLRMQTQWNVTMGGYVGLKYEVLLGASGLMSLYDVDNPREMLEGLRVMEAAALLALNKSDK